GRGPDTAPGSRVERACRRAPGGATEQKCAVHRAAASHHRRSPEADYLSLERGSAPGTDGVTWQAYGENLAAKLTGLHDRIHKGSYRARPARRTYIPKADGSQRLLSIWCLEDKIVRQAVVTVLEALLTRKTSSASPMGSGRGVASTMRWTLSTSAS